MALQLGDLRDALIEAGATPETAGKAAEEVAGYDNHLASIDTRLTLLAWMVGGLYAVGAGVLWALVVR